MQRDIYDSICDVSRIICGFLSILQLLVKTRKHKTKLKMDVHWTAPVSTEGEYWMRWQLACIQIGSINTVN